MIHHEAEEIKLGLDLSYKQNTRNLYVASDSMITSKTCKVIRLVRDIIYKFENCDIVYTEQNYLLGSPAILC